MTNFSGDGDMMLATFTKNLNLSPPEVEELLSLSLTDLLESPTLVQKLGSINTHLLLDTLPTAGKVLASHFMPFYDWLKHDLGVQRVPEGPEHTTKWLVNFLKNEETLNKLVELHRPVPRPALVFEEIEDDTIRQEWETAVSALCLVLAVAAPEQTPVAQYHAQSIQSPIQFEIFCQP